jgi:glycosyltransferase involved in cell wall biosynthesis
MISVVISAYNYGKFLEQSIKSALGQDYPKHSFEIIVIDDGSTDNTPEIANKYNEQIKYIRQKNAGQAGVFNTAFRESNGEILCFLDADDYWYPGKLKTIIPVFEKYADAGMVQHHSDFVDANSNPLKNKFEKLPNFYDLEYFKNNRVYFNGTTNLSFRKTFLSNIMPEPPAMGNYADQYLYWNILFYAKVYNLNSTLAAHRVHGSNWYAKMYINPDMISMHINVLEAVNVSVRANFKKLAVPLTKEPPALLEQDMEVKKEKIILCRLQLKLFKALTAYGSLFKNRFSGFTFFKIMTLFLALIHPGLYLYFFRLYSKTDLLPKIRERLMPSKN